MPIQTLKEFIEKIEASKTEREKAIKEFDLALGADKMSGAPPYSKKSQKKARKVLRLSGELLEYKILLLQIKGGNSPNEEEIKEIDKYVLDIEKLLGEKKYPHGALVKNYSELNKK